MSDPSAAASLFASSRATRAWLGLCLLWLAWLLTGIFPVTALEGDDQGVIHGAMAMATGNARDWELRYLYEIQPGAYVVISGLVRVTGASAERVFAGLSAGGALLFAACGALFVRRLLAAPWPMVAVGFLLSQEIWAGAYYLNTTAVGGWLAMLALLLALRPLTLRRSWALALLLALAGWIRIDCLLISPVVGALVWRRHHAWRPALRELLPAALLCVALEACLYFASRVDLGYLVEIFRARGGQEGWGRLIRMYCLVTSGLVGGLSLVGLGLIVLRRRDLLSVWLGGAGLSLAVYGSSLASNKYLYLATPFFILAAIVAAQEVLQRWPGWSTPWRLTAVGIAGGLLIFDTVAGVLTSSSAYRLYEPRPQLAVIASAPVAGRTRQLTFGAGELVATTDGYRMRGGTLFAPAAWTRDKAELIRRLDGLAAILRAPGDCSVFVGEWLGYQLVLRVLRQEGFNYASEYVRGAPFPFAGRWSNGPKSVHLAFLAYTRSIYFDRHRATPNTTGTNTYFVGTLGELGGLAELTDGRHWQLHSSDPYGYIRMHQRL